MNRVAQGITREMLETDRLRALMVERYPDTPVLDDPALQRSIAATLAHRPHDADLRDGVWVFGYGSLPWNPCLEFDDRQAARIHGFHRSFCLQDTDGRGSPRNPGLTLGLAPGGACRGIGLHLPTNVVRRELLLLWRREMVTDVYRPRWVRLRMADRDAAGVAFVVNRAHPTFVGRLTEHRAAHMVAFGEGPMGCCLDYLERTVDQLERDGIRDRRLLQMRDTARAQTACR